MKHLYMIMLTLATIICSCNTATKTDTNDEVEILPTSTQPSSIAVAAADALSNEATTGNFTFKIFEAGNQKGYGYDIYMNEKIVIHQPTIPAVSGNQYFKTKEKAEKAASMMIYKMQHHIMPPTISIRELDSLKCM